METKLAKRVPRWLRGSLPVCAVMSAALACGSNDGTGPQRGPSVQIVAGAGLTDTIQARPLQALAVAVRDSSGAPRSGIVVRFEALLERAQPAIFSAPLTSPTYVLFIPDTTDARGRAHVLVSFARQARPARVAVTVPELGLADTARYTVIAGAAARVVFTTPDTALAVSKRFSPNASAADRFANRRPDPLTYTSMSALCSVDAGGQITGVAVGRCAILVRSGALSDTARARRPGRHARRVLDGSA